MASSLGRIIYGPKRYYPIFGEEGGTQRLHLGILKTRDGNSLYFVFRYGDCRYIHWVQKFWWKRG